MPGRIQLVALGAGGLGRQAPGPRGVSPCEEGGGDRLGSRASLLVQVSGNAQLSVWPGGLGGHQWG